MKLGDSGVIARREGAVVKERCHCWRAVQRIHIEWGAIGGIVLGDNGQCATRPSPGAVSGFHEILSHVID
jgi:hypothetical protein